MLYLIILTKERYVSIFQRNIYNINEKNIHYRQGCGKQDN